MTTAITSQVADLLGQMEEKLEEFQALLNRLQQAQEPPPTGTSTNAQDVADWINTDLQPLAATVKVCLKTYNKL